MTDDERINFGNLVKLRAADRILRDVIPFGPVLDEEVSAVVLQIQKWTDSLERIENSNTSTQR